TGVTRSGNTLTASATFSGTPSTFYVIEFFSSAAASAAGFLEGEQFLGAAVIRTTANGTATFSRTFTGAFAQSVLITATATDTAGNTSEFFQPTAEELNPFDTIGLFAGGPSGFFLRDSNSAGVADASFGYGPGAAGWTPLAGDWDDNDTDTVALY